MAKRKKKKINPRLVLVSVLFTILLLATGVLTLKLLQSEENTLVKNPLSKISPTPTPIHIATPEEVNLELSLLEEYYRNNNLSFPDGYQNLTYGQEKIAKLVGAIFDREISWRSGGYIFVSFIGSPQDVEGVDRLRAQAKAKIGSYYERAKERESISVLIDEANKDSEIENLNKFLAFRQETLYDLLYQSKIFSEVARDDGLISGSEDFDEAVFANEEGYLSDIIEHQYGFFFGAITDSYDGNYDTYSDWIENVSSGKLSRSVFQFAKISR